MRPKSVKIAGVELEDVEDVRFDAAKPPSAYGYPSGQTAAMEITLKRYCAEAPSPLGFELATNGDGQVKIVSGEIVLQNAKKRATYTLKITDGFVSRWELVSPERRKTDDEPAYELWVIYAGNVELSGKGGSAAFILKTFPTSE